MADFDFLVLYKTVTETIKINDDYSMIVTVGEIPHGEYVELQKRLMGKFHLSQDKREMQRQLQNIQIDPTQFSDEKNMLAIKSWSIQNGTGDPVSLDITMDNWHKLPHSVTEQIEKVVEQLNPELDDEFQD